MEVVNSHCAGLDVHKKSVVACRITPDKDGGWRKDIRRFGTLTVDLLAVGSKNLKHGSNVTGSPVA